MGELVELSRDSPLALGIMMGSCNIHVIRSPFPGMLPHLPRDGQKLCKLVEVWWMFTENNSLKKTFLRSATWESNSISIHPGDKLRKRLGVVVEEVQDDELIIQNSLS